MVIGGKTLQGRLSRGWDVIGERRLRMGCQGQDALEQLVIEPSLIVSKKN